MWYDVVVGGTKDTADSVVPTVLAATEAAFANGYCELSVPDLGIFPRGVDYERKQSLMIEAFGEKHILVCARESTNIAREIRQCKELLGNLTQCEDFSHLDRVFLKMNGQLLAIVPEASNDQLAKIYLRTVYDGQQGVLRELVPATSLDEYVFTVAAVRELTKEPVAFVWQGQRRELLLHEKPHQVIGELLYGTGA